MTSAMPRCLTPPWVIVFIITVGFEASYADDAIDFSGDVRTRYALQTFPDDSLIHDLTGDNSQDLSVLTRLKLAYDYDRLDFRADYQFIYLYGDRIEYTRNLPEIGGLPGRRLPDDRTRLFDLTHVFKDEGKTAIVQRLDRLTVGYTGPKAVLRFGRQAVSWGNGLVYTPMDIFNPFDPAAVDTEYKSGDDMLYAQYLRNSGDDFQSVLVIRRDAATGEVEAAASSLALKYHGFLGSDEYDLLVAQHYDEPLLGIGGNTALGGAIWRGDVTLAFTDDDEEVASVVTSMAYSWTWGGKNISGVAEYFFNGFGQRDGDYSAAGLAQNPALVKRLARGELFTLGRHYLVVSATIEMTPLFLLTPNVFFNLADSSSLIQIVTQNDLLEDFVLLGALNIPVGPSGTEFGGIETEVQGQYLSSDLSAFLQLVWYF